MNFSFPIRQAEGNQCYRQLGEGECGQVDGMNFEIVAGAAGYLGTEASGAVHRRFIFFIFSFQSYFSMPSEIPVIPVSWRKETPSAGSCNRPLTAKTDKVQKIL